MTSWFRARLTYANVVATGALAAALGGVGFAAIPDGSGVIHGCYDSGTGALRVTDSQDSAPRPCSPSSETALDWNQRGPQGPAAAIKIDQGYGVVDPGRRGVKPFFVFSEHLASVRRVKTGHYCVRVGFDARRLSSEATADLSHTRRRARGLVFVDVEAKDCNARAGGFQREIEFITERIDKHGVGHTSNKIGFTVDPTG